MNYFFLFFIFYELIIICSISQNGLSVVWTHYAKMGIDTTIEDSPDDIMTQISDLSRELLMDYPDQRDKTKVIYIFIYFIIIF